MPYEQDAGWWKETTAYRLFDGVPVRLQDRYGEPPFRIWQMNLQGEELFPHRIVLEGCLEALAARRVLRWYSKPAAITIQAAAGDYWLCGPNLSSNDDLFEAMVLMRHRGHDLPNCPREASAIHDYLMVTDVFGVLFVGADGRSVMATRPAGVIRPREDSGSGFIRMAGQQTMLGM